MGEFSGIDPSAMQNMITSYSKDKDQLRQSATSIKSSFDKFGLDTSGLTELLSICDWLDGQLATLTRHQVLGAALQRAHPGLTVVQVPEPVIGAAQAQREGQALAELFNKASNGDGNAGDAYHTIAQQLAAHKDDPDYCAAFYAGLKPPGAAQMLPGLLANTGGAHASDDLKAYSQAFGAACSDAYPPPGLNNVKKLFMTPPPKGDNAAAWGRAAMLQYGQFPTDFLVKVTRANGLDQFAHDKNQDFRGASPYEVQALGLPQDIVALDLKALGNNGDAARQALSQMGQTGNKTDLQGNLKSLIGYAKQGDPDVLNSLKAALAAGSGDHVTQSSDGAMHVDPTMHGGYEANFAATAMSALAQSHVDYNQYRDYIDGTFKAYSTPPGANSDQEGAQDAFLLHLATSADPHWTPTRQAIKAVGSDAAAKKGDLDFMQAFYAEGADRFETQVAATLHAEDGTHNGQVLNSESQKILAQYGANLAEATNLEAAGKIPSGITDAFTNPPDMWSAAMLLKYGPSGDQWDHTFLTAMGDAVLHWRKTHEMRPSYTAPMTTISGYVPGGFVDPDHAWYSELGLKEDSFTMNMDSQMAVARGIADNDPSLAVLSKLADNATASRDLLSGKDGRFAAEQLVSNQWQTPGLNDDESAFPAEIITLATRKTSDLSANERAATSAQNVFQAAIEDYHTWKGASDYDKEQYSRMPPKLAMAMADVAGLYTPDLAASVNNEAPSNPKWNDLRFGVEIDPKTHQAVVVTDGKAIDQLIHEILRDPTAGGAYSGYVRAYITAVANNAGQDPDRAQNLIRELGNLDGHVETAKSDAPYSLAEKQDEADTEKQKYTWVVGGVLSAVPVPFPEGSPAYLDTMVGLVQTAIAGETANKSYDFGGGHAATVLSKEQAKSYAEMLSLQYPIVQGLINAHKLPKPGNSSWCHNGQLDFDAILKDPLEFNEWQTQNGVTDNLTYQKLFNAAKDGYGESTTERAANSDAQQDGN